MATSPSSISNARPISSNARPISSNARPISSAARDWREGRRLRALELIAEGYRSSEIARVLGVSAGAVSQWLKRAKLGGGAAALLRRKARGRGARLDAEQLRELRAMLTQANAGVTWTSRRVARLIHEKWGVEYSRAHVSRILKKIGFVSLADGGGLVSAHAALESPVRPSARSAEPHRV